MKKILVISILAPLIFFGVGCSENEEVKKAEDGAKIIAEYWIKNNSETYKTDGFDLSLDKVKKLDCKECYQFTFSFQSRAAGYGNRTGKMVAQVITPHTARIVVEESEVTEAVLDEQYDIIGQEMVE